MLHEIFRETTFAQQELKQLGTHHVAALRWVGGLLRVVLLKVVISVEVVFGTCAMAKADPSALLSFDALY